MPLELILDSPLNENFFNDQNIMDLLKGFKAQELTYQNNTKLWIKEAKLKKNEELYKMSLKLNKSLKCFYQCEDCIIRNSIECCMDRIILKVFYNYLFNF